MFFFLHIPRTAGTTLNTIIRNNFAPDELISVYDSQDYKLHAAHSAEELHKIRLVQGHLLLQSYDPPLFWGQPVNVFTFLREPVSRLVSEYHFLRSWKANHLYEWLHREKVDFRRYIESREPQLRFRGRNFMTRCISGCSLENRDLPFKAVAVAKRHLEKSFGFVGIQERFLESLILLGDFLGMSNLLHERNNALHGLPDDSVSAEDRAVAAERNQGDAAVYRFACELFEERVAAHGASLTERVERFKALNQRYCRIADALRRQSGAQTICNGIDRPKDGHWR